LLRQLLRPEEFGAVDARPRIVCPTPLEPSKRWVDLEHWRMAQAMLPPPQAQASRAVPADEAAWWWWGQPAACALMTALLPQHQPFRRDTQQRVDLCLRPTDDDPERIELTEVVDAKKGSGKRYVSAQSRCKKWEDEAIFSAPGICAWTEPSYTQALAELAQTMNMPLQRCAERFGTVSLPASEQGWWWHVALGFVRRK
jgi:CRISPR-associated endonuclease/helicase Cas3